MKFDPVYERAIALWPETIPIDDLMIPEPEKKKASVASTPAPSSTPVAGDPRFFPRLTRVWAAAEETVDPGAEPWVSMMLWTMYQVFHAAALDLHARSAKTLEVRNVDVDVLEAHFFENLHARGWEEELASYERNLPF
jgi:hypothetical protein